MSEPIEAVPVDDTCQRSAAFDIIEQAGPRTNAIAVIVRLGAIAVQQLEDHAPGSSNVTVSAISQALGDLGVTGDEVRAAQAHLASVDAALADALDEEARGV